MNTPHSITHITLLDNVNNIVFHLLLSMSILLLYIALPLCVCLGDVFRYRAFIAKLDAGAIHCGGRRCNMVQRR